MSRWNALPVDAAQRFYDHVTESPGAPPDTKTSTVLKGRAGRPLQSGFSRTIHYEVSGAGRIDYQYNDAYVGQRGDPHPVVFVFAIDVSSH
jgi:hypothetical protein